MNFILEFSLEKFGINCVLILAKQTNKMIKTSNRLMIDTSAAIRMLKIQCSVIEELRQEYFQPKLGTKIRIFSMGSNPI